jgi:cytochrome c biogenesis protein CcmG, thiol:disulfide interchange protein DsbE
VSDPPGEVPRRAGLSGGWLTLIFAAVVGVGALLTLPGDEPAAAGVGAPAPSFAIDTFDGESFDLAAHLDRGGGPVLLNLWASWCGPCREEFPLLSEFAAAHGEVTVVGVAVRDEMAAARRFAMEMDPAFPVGFDTDGVVADSYPSFGLPATYLIDGDGTVVELVAGRLTEESLESLVTSASDDAA